MPSDCIKEQFWEDGESGEVHIRDRWQFALKSDFSGSDRQYVQEFYLFIPNSLQINENTYSKNQFYQNQTTLIRFKTPEFTFAELLDVQMLSSPLTRVLLLCQQGDHEERRQLLSNELKLLGNVVRSTLRRETRSLMSALDQLSVGDAADPIINEIKQLLAHVRQLRQSYQQAEQYFLHHWKNLHFYRQLLYIDEFISDSTVHFLTALLEHLRSNPHSALKNIDLLLCDAIVIEQRLGSSLQQPHPLSIQTLLNFDANAGELFMHRASLLNKFILDALLLHTDRFSLDRRYQHWFGALSAGVAMLLYFSLYVWLGNVFVINSLPFILLTVTIYILKDRIKEWLRTFSYQYASRFFFDYTTIIRPPNKKKPLGILKESVSFVSASKLTPELQRMRNREFHLVLESFSRPESILFYKRIVDIHPSLQGDDSRRSSLNIIFRFNIWNFLAQASDPQEGYLALDPKTLSIASLTLPRVYHLNLIIKNTSFHSKYPPKVEWQKLRIVIDKNGLKRIEQL